MDFPQWWFARMRAFENYNYLPYPYDFYEHEFLNYPSDSSSICSWSSEKVSHCCASWDERSVFSCLQTWQSRGGIGMASNWCDSDDALLCHWQYAFCSEMKLQTLYDLLHIYWCLKMVDWFLLIPEFAKFTAVRSLPRVSNPNMLS